MSDIDLDKLFPSFMPHFNVNVPMPRPRQNFDNSGDFRGASVIQGSSLSNIGTIAGTIFAPGDPAREALPELLGQLAAALKGLPPAAREDAEAIETATAELVQAAAQPEPNRKLLRVKGSALAELAQGVAAKAPAVVMIAERIVGLVGKLHGIG